ncbi:DUF317 domain-containing protein [Streptomyces sp. So13.3]|uniref:DUF317 domain-containing protein n=1 Tax=unclassified Streptomyces TaxID=2593676 RepID=UPI0011074979|nr:MULTISPECIES: DUF317 domain-containing protein [unclassified Streptomyces]NEA75436.1 DUF317 domain-containing protein [Streptomyces sp. SID13588]QNA73134.1 DUF317 domain-containing protein [Streptomyces sp. So13.3]
MSTAASVPGGLAPDNVLRACPVYLAGPGNTAQIYDTLSEHRWATAATDSGRMFTSPRQHAQLARLPEGSYGGWKAVEYREPFGMPLWSATFSRNTPAEITAAFATALAKGLPSRHRDFLSGGTHYQSPNSPARVLAVRGWETTDTPRHLYQHSPDEHAAFVLRKNHLDAYAELEGAEPAQWAMYGGLDQANPESWQASFTSATPLHLVRAAVVALTSAEPVERTRGEIPERHLPYVDVQPVDEEPDPRRSAALARTPNASGPRTADLSASAAAASLPLPAPSRRH